jgi:hypothetical protein
MIIDFLLLSLGIYIAYKVLFDLVIPIFRTTQKIRQQFGAMNQHMQDHMNTQNGYTSQPKQAPADKNKTSRAGDYIDFEEVK